MANILIAEDSPSLREGLSMLLTSNFHVVRAVEDGNAALEEYRKFRPELMILDLMMPNKGGLEVCTEIRCSNSAVPIIIISAKSTVADRIQALGLGADDYLPKPFAHAELLAHVEALIRRNHVYKASLHNIVPLGKGRIIQNQLCYIRSDGTKARLSYTQMRILLMLLQHANTVVPRADLYARFWSRDLIGSSRSLDQVIYTLRVRMGVDGAYLKTANKIGYMLLCEQPISESGADGCGGWQ